jgi:hypothetical protein
MYHLDVNSEWNAIHNDDLWIYNKLQLSRVLGYTCGPVGTTVPKPDFYVVRPAINFLGMGRFAEIKWIDESTEDLYPSNFWCEIFKGEHLSVDFCNQESKLVVRGIRDTDAPLYKWKRWEKIDKKIKFPSILKKLKGNYDWINCEFIDDNLIEVHIRQNSDFRYNNNVAIPIWDDEFIKNDNYVRDSDYKRKGFYIDNGIETP